MSQLKQDSIDSHALWCSSGKPKSGPIYDIFRNAKYAYKLCIKRSKSDAEVTITNELHDALCSKDNNNFWKIWNSKFAATNKENMNKVINGMSCPKKIADEFSNYFQNICKPNTHSFDNEWRSKFKSDVANYFGDHLTSESLFTTELVGKIVA